MYECLWITVFFQTLEKWVSLQHANQSYLYLDQWQGSNRWCIILWNFDSVLYWQEEIVAANLRPFGEVWSVSPQARLLFLHCHFTLSLNGLYPGTLPLQHSCLLCFPCLILTLLTHSIVISAKRKDLLLLYLYACVCVRVRVRARMHM